MRLNALKYRPAYRAEEEHYRGCSGRQCDAGQITL